MNPALARGSTLLVVGGGVVGTCTAYALSEAGYVVTLVTSERIGDGASAGNAGLIVPADSVVWPSPGNARAVPATLLGRGGTSIDISWRNPRTIPWGLQFLRNSTGRKYAAACRFAHELSVRSLDVIERWAGNGYLGTDLKRTGMLFLVDSAAAIESTKRARAPLSGQGETYTALSRTELVALDNAYGSCPTDLHAVFAPGAARGDSQAFARALVNRLRGSTATAIENETVTRLLVRKGRVCGVATSTGALYADAIVVAAGTGTTKLARTVGARVRILPVKGYAATVPITDSERAPDVGGVLEAHHVAFSRMGDKVRLSTGAEIGRTDHAVTPQARELLKHAGDLLFPGALDWASANYRAEHRPMTPSGLPLIGPTRIPGLYLNSGHGSLGWTQAAGSAELLARLIDGEPAPIDPTAFLPNQVQPRHQPIDSPAEETRP